MGRVMGHPHTSVWDVGMPWVGSECRESESAVGGHLSVRVHGYAVVGPETWGHGCGARGGEGWKAGVPRVGRQWDVNGGGGGGT